jgi:hypothetical protein
MMFRFVFSLSFTGIADTAHWKVRRRRRDIWGLKVILIFHLLLKIQPKIK